jgi:FMN phosphatase YigB (HAD superfamily)
MFERAFRDFPGAHAGNSIMVGDSLRDIEAGARLGMRTIFICNSSASESRAADADRATALASAVALSLPNCVQQIVPSFTPGVREQNNDI